LTDDREGWNLRIARQSVGQRGRWRGFWEVRGKEAGGQKDERWARRGLPPEWEGKGKGKGKGRGRGGGKREGQDSGLRSSFKRRYSQLRKHTVLRFRIVPCWTALNRRYLPTLLSSISVSVVVRTPSNAPWPMHACPPNSPNAPPLQIPNPNFPTAHIVIR
jgi:hypothetical protein